MFCKLPDGSDADLAAQVRKAILGFVPHAGSYPAPEAGILSKFIQ